jgi:hypothetical protein
VEDARTIGPNVAIAANCLGVDFDYNFIRQLLYETSFFARGAGEAPAAE